MQMSAATPALPVSPSARIRVLHKGPLSKKGKHRKNWLSREFTLIGNRFGPKKLIYSDLDNGTQKGCIGLADAKWDVSPKNPRMFEIVTPKRTYQLVAATKAEARCWLAKLNYRDEQTIRDAYVDPVTGEMTERVNARKQEMLDMVLQAESRASQVLAEMDTELELEPEPELGPEPELEPLLKVAPDDSGTISSPGRELSPRVNEQLVDRSGELGLPPGSPSPIRMSDKSAVHVGDSADDTIVNTV